MNTTRPFAPTRTRERVQLLLEICDDIERTPTGVLPWNPRYAEVFDDRTDLLRALQHHWDRMAQAQVDDMFDVSDLPSDSWHELAARHPGLRMILDRHQQAGRPVAARA
ncbi:hypothetical protein [Rhodococcus spelaei]|uniref:hypothetical protein n=1 Tax=Rhodococcus spelaei TaxID=2546320 RepID=UPI0015EF1A41|nr:hypothetical protein [Rhodococcus spelaei]